MTSQERVLKMTTAALVKMLEERDALLNNPEETKLLKEVERLKNRIRKLVPLREVVLKGRKIWTSQKLITDSPELEYYFRALWDALERAKDA